MGSNFSLGLDYIPVDADVSDKTKTRTDVETSVTGTATATTTSRTQSAQAEISDHMTLYATYSLDSGAYFKLGYIHADLNTLESLGTGSTYGDTDLDGQTIGFGTNVTMDNGVFVRAEANYMTFDSSEGLTSGDNTVTLTNLDGVTASIKVGKSF